MEFSEKLFQVTLCYRRKFWLLFMFCIIFGIGVVPFLVSLFLHYYVGGNTVFWAPLFIVGVLSVWFVLTYPRVLYRNFEKSGFLEERTYRIQDGLLYYNGKETVSPCRLYTHTYQTKKLVLIGRELSKESIMLVPFPKRCFDGKEEIAAFLDSFQNPVQAQVEEHPQGGAFNYYFTLDPDAWIHIYTQISQLNQAVNGISRRTSNILLLILGSAGIIYSIVHALVFQRYTLLFFMVCFAGAASRLALRSRRTYDEAYYRKMYEKNMLPMNSTGNWEISFMEEKIRLRSQESVCDCRWDEYTTLVETADTFYLMHIQRGIQTNFLPVPKWLFKSREELEGFVAFCVRHGVRPENPESLRMAMNGKACPEREPDGASRKKQRRAIVLLLAAALCLTLLVLALSCELARFRHPPSGSGDPGAIWDRLQVQSG